MINRKREKERRRTFDVVLEGKGREVIHVTQADAKLALLSSSPHMSMVSISLARINSNEDLLPTQQIGPLFELEPCHSIT